MAQSKHHIAGYVSALIFIACLTFPRLFAYGPALWSLIIASLYYQNYKSDVQNSIRSILKTYRPALFLLGYFYIWIWCSSLWSINPEASIERATKLSILGIANLSVFLTIPRVLEHIKIDYNKSLRFSFLAIGILSFTFYMERMLNFPVHELIYGAGEDYRAKFNRQVVCIISVFLPLCYAALKLSNIDKKTKHYMGLCAILVGFLVLFSYSQAAQITLIAATCSLFLFPWKYNWSWPSLRFSIMLLTILMPFISIIGYTYITWETVKAYKLLLYASLDKRLEIWYFVSLAILDNPSFGYGLGTSRYMEFDAPLVRWKSNSVLHPHSIPLQLWLELGLPILFLLCAVISGLMKFIKSKISSRIDLLLLGSFLGWLAIAFTCYGAWQGWFVGVTVFLAAFWFFIFVQNKQPDQN
jgi:O-antigen ligase